MAGIDIREDRENMRLSWKLFFVTTPLFVLFLTVFGSWMLQDSFQSSLDKEIQRRVMENQMLQNSYEMAWNSLTARQQQAVTTKQVVESFYRHQVESDGNFRIYDKNREVIYQAKEFRMEHAIWEELDSEHNAGYELIRQGNRTYLAVLGKSSLDIYVETIRDISSIYQDREEMQSRYQMGVVVVTFLVGGVTLILLFFVMRNMQKLSRATRQYARGRFDARVDIRSTDEIGLLAADFNWMADVMNDQMKRLQEEVRRQEEFTAAFAHELKTPLTSIIGYADTIRQMELTPEENNMCANYIYNQGKRLQSLSYKLLDMAMLEKTAFSFREIPVPEFMEEVSRTVSPSLKEKNITLYTNYQKGIIWGDRDLLASVFINLIDNARKVSPEGTAIWFSGQAVFGGYVMAVQDQGPGLPQEELSRITEAFYMVDKSRSRKEGGAGLGLALCRKIIDLHHASWKLESQLGRGLRVTVLFGSASEERETLETGRE